nr:hypothetical protein [Neisseria gonorrhoeae]
MGRGRRCEYRQTNYRYRRHRSRPVYKHRHFKASGSFVLDGGNIRVDPTKINEYGVRVGVKF